jgi:hypothetical protein
LLNGQNLGYLQAGYVEADAAIKAPGASRQMVTSGEGVINGVQDLANWTTEMKPVLIGILTTSSRADLNQGVTEAAALAAKMLNGIDTDEDGVVEAVVGEGGAQVVYEEAYRMADMPLQAVGIMNVGTGTPTFILVAPSTTPGGGGSGSGGSTTGSTPQAPGQQRTPKPTNDNKPPPKNTKKPTGNNNGSTSNTTTDNTNNGNNKNGN